MAYSSVNDAGCQKGPCCKNSSCCNTQRTEKATAYSLQRSAADRYALVCDVSTFSLSRLVLDSAHARRSQWNRAMRRDTPRPFLATNAFD